MSKTDRTIDKGEAAKASPFALFSTDGNVETKGIDLDYGAFYFTIARAGGANERFKKMMAAKTKPYRRLIENDTLPDDVSRSILHHVVARTVVLGWGSSVHGPGKMIGREGEAIDFSAEAVEDLFAALPDLFADLWAQAQKASHFRVEDQAADAGN